MVSCKLWHEHILLIIFTIVSIFVRNGPYLQQCVKSEHIPCLSSTLTQVCVCVCMCVHACTCAAVTIDTRKTLFLQYRSWKECMHFNDKVYKLKLFVGLLPCMSKGFEVCTVLFNDYGMSLCSFLSGKLHSWIVSHKWDICKQCRHWCLRCQIFLSPCSLPLLIVWS